MKNYIKQTLADYLKNYGVDSYGQIKIISISVFGDKMNEVLEYNKEHELLPIATYGNRFGNYKGFNPTAIQDSEILNACNEAKKMNSTYINAMTSW